MQLQQSVENLRARGLGLAAISYDPPATLAAFAKQRAITFPLLSDVGSATIKRYGILNTAASGTSAGIPHPGTLVIDGNGIVVSRSFEEKYQERASPGSLLARSDRAIRAAGSPETTTVETQHLTLTTSSSDGAVAPGTRFSLIVDVIPKAKMHVYAPEQRDYIPISLTIKPDAAFRAHPAVYPKAERFFFAPLKETQLVYSKPFRIIQDVTVALTPDVRDRARRDNATLAIAGNLRYQACDDAICYLPKEIPVTWTARLRSLER